MALTAFAGGELVAHGSDASIDDLNVATVIAVVQETSAAFNPIWGKGANTEFRFLGGGTPSLQFRRRRATAHCQVQADSANFAAHALNKWLIVAASWDTSTGANCRLLIGDKDTPPAEPSAYSSQTAGSGTVNSDAGDNCEVCGTGSSSLTGHISKIMVVAAVLTPAQIQAIAYRLRPVGDTRFFVHYGRNGLGTQRDLSGHGNHGTISGTVSEIDDPPWVRGFTRRGRVFVPVALGNDTTLAAAVTCLISSTGALSTDITMAGQATLAIGTAAALSSDIQMAAQASLAVAAAGSLSTDIRLAAAVSLAITITGDLTTGADFAAAVTCSVTAAGALTTDIRLAGAAGLSVSAVGALSTDIRLAGAVSLSLSTAGQLATDIRMAGVATCTATGVGALATDIRLSGAVSCAIAATGSLQVGTPVTYGPSRLTGVTMTAPSLASAVLTAPRLTDVDMDPESA